MKTTKGRRTGRGDDEYDDYAPPHPESESAVASSDLEPAIMFTFKGKEAVSAAVGYTEVVFAVFARGYLLVILDLSTVAVTNEVTASIGAAI